MFRPFRRLPSCESVRGYALVQGISCCPIPPADSFGPTREQSYIPASLTTNSLVEDGLVETLMRASESSEITA